jgi:hypothetical protein
MIKEIEALKDEYTIYALGRTAPHDPKIEFISIDKIYGITRLIAKFYSVIFKKYYAGRLFFFEYGLHRLIDKIRPDIIINHNPIFFPAIFSYKKYLPKVVYNAHEYHPMQFEDQEWLNTAGAYYSEIYRDYLPKIDLLINVCDSIAQKCEEEFGKSSLVIPNAAPFHPDVSPQETKADQIVRIIHHGAAISGRRIEKMIQAVGEMENYQLDLMLIPNDKKYYQKLIDLAKEFKNIRIIPAVPYNDIVKFICQYDIGLYILNPGSFNNKVALPNKLFEFVQARLAIIVSPNDEIAAIVKKNYIGIVTNGFETSDLKLALNGLSVDQINVFKNNCDLVAQQLSAEVYYDKMKEAIRAL